MIKLVRLIKLVTEKIKYSINYKLFCYTISSTNTKIFADVMLLFNRVSNHDLSKYLLVWIIDT